MWSPLHFTILPSLGYAVLSSLWQGALLWLLYVALVRLFQPAAAQRYRMASAASATSLLLFFASLLLAPKPGTALPVAAPISHATVPIWYQLLPALGIGYLLLAAWQLTRLAIGWQQVQQLRHQHTSKAPLAWRLFVQQYAAYMGITKPVKLVISSRISSPLTIGFWKPMILFPVASINQLTLAQAEAILIHELAHIRRADYLLNYLLQLAAAILFFNPFHRLLVQAACRDREISCDEWVLRYNYNRRDYAEALLQVERMAVVPCLAMAAASQPGFELLHRIRLMLVPNTQPMLASRQRMLWWPTGLLLLAMLLQLTLPALQAVHPAQTAKAAALLSRLRPGAASYDFLAARAMRQSHAVHQSNQAFATSGATNMAWWPLDEQSRLPAEDTRTSADEVPADEWTAVASRRWLQPVQQLLQQGEAVLKATDALPANELEHELLAQLEAAAIEMQQQYEQQLLNAQVLAAEASANKAEELAAARAALQATSIHLQKLSAALAGQLSVERKKSSLRISLPAEANQVSDGTAAIPLPTNRSYQFSYNEVSNLPVEIPLYSPKAIKLADITDAALAADAEEDEALQNEPEAAAALKATLQLAVPQPAAIRQKLEKETKAAPRKVRDQHRPRVVISL